MTQRHHGLAVGAVALAAGVTALLVARGRPDLSLAADSTLAQIAFLLAGWLAIAAGVVRSWEGERLLGTLLVLAGCAWFVAETNSPGAQFAPLFTLGLVGAAATPAFLAHAGLTVARPPRWRTLAGFAYAAAIGVLGVGGALVFDPVAEGCSDCAANLLRVASRPGLHVDVERWGTRLAAVVAIAASILIAWPLVVGSATRRRALAPTLVPIAGFLAFAAAAHLRAWDRGFFSNDPTDRALWFGQAACLAGIAAGVGLERIRARRTRVALAGLVVELATSPRPGGLRGVLAISLGDPSLEIRYPVRGGGWIDQEGRSAVRRPGQAETTLTRDGAVVAVVLHRPGLLEDARLVHEIQRAARLAIDHERLQADLGAQLARLRESRARIVAASDAERRRLERDLHDGAQQGLVRLALYAGPGPAGDELSAALQDLRALAHGIFPSVLKDQGLAAAIVSLAEWNPRVQIDALPGARCPAQTEAAAYFCVAGLAQDAGRLEISGVVEDGRLVLTLNADHVSSATAVDLEDRTGALGGSLNLKRVTDGVAHLRLEFPCA
jgi:hypothetical protein